MKKDMKEKIEVRPDAIVCWVDNNSWGDRSDPMATKVKDVEFGTSPRFPLAFDEVKEKKWKNIFVTLKGNSYYSIMVRLYKEDGKFFVYKDENLSQEEQDQLKKVLYKN